jgi:hypothetical protein
MVWETTHIAKQRMMMNPIEKILHQYPPEVVKSPDIPEKLKKYLKTGDKILITAKFTEESKGDNQCVQLFQFFIGVLLIQFFNQPS